MTSVQTLTVAEDEADIRLDRWFKRHFPQLSHGRLEKLLRTGQVRVDGGRCKANDRLVGGQEIRVPPLPDEPDPAPRTDRPVDATLAAELRKRVLYRDDLVIAIDKPAGLAVQGGSGQTRHLDGALDELRFGSEERPRLVHRLDKDTSGVLILARTAAAAAALSEAFRHRSTRKLYWALSVGVPEPSEGKIDKPLAKIAAEHGERVAMDEEDGKRAITRYATLDTAGRRAAWLALMPLTGRTHQLRVHLSMIGTPILGDRKYGGEAAYLHGAVNKKLHLHARRLKLPDPKGRGWIDVTAPLPPHMLETWGLLGLDPADRRDPFAED
jgi:23S rRNA pseudouridine955/2504/2580 synthase